MDFQTLIVKIAKILDGLKITYCVTGGYAVAVWGRLRATFDLDVVIELFQPDIPLLAEKMKKIGKAVYADESMMRSALLRHGEFNVIHPESGLKIDFFTLKEGAAAKREMARRQAKRIKNQKVYFISPEDLILNKLRWYNKGGGEHHLEDAASVIKKSGEILDFAYLRQNVKGEALTDLWQKIQ